MLLASAYVGPIGAGAIAKLVHNMIGICTQAILAEGLTLGVKAGVDPEPLRKAIADGAVGQGLMLNYMVPNVIFKGDFDTPRFALKLARKDIGLASALGREFEVPLKIANLVDGKATAQAAVEAPRVHTEGAEVLVSTRVCDKALAGLGKKGHAVVPKEESYSTLNFARPVAIRVTARGLEAGCEQYSAASAAGH